jgi:hypothetical protein
MLKKLILPTFYAAITFCVISYFTVLYSLLPFFRESGKPVTNIGFPYKYYEQFWITGSDFPNFGWMPSNFFKDWFITWIICVAVYFLLKRKTD